MAEQACSEKSEKSLGAEVLVVGIATERAPRHGVIWRKTSHGTDGRERLPTEYRSGEAANDPSLPVQPRLAGYENEQSNGK
jgi:hypothetical protein